MHILIAFCISMAILGSFYNEVVPPAEEFIFSSTPSPTDKINCDLTPLSEIKYHNIIKQAYDYSCGSAALSTLLNYYMGEKYSEESVINGLIKYGDSELIAKNRAFSLYDMKRYIEAIGYEGNGYSGNIEDLRGLDKPGILAIDILSYRHFVIFKGIHKGHVFLSDPMQGNISFPEKQFARIWFRNIIFLIGSDIPDSLNRLKINENDLRFIDEDATLLIIKNSLQNIELKEIELITDHPQQKQCYYGK